jgi:hypothetical protein
MTRPKGSRATSASQTDSEEPTRVATRSKNKNVHPGREAGVGRRTRDEIQAAKAAREAEREQVRVEKEEKEAAAVAKIAAIERKQEARYALDETPRAAAPLTRRRTSRPGNLASKKGAASTASHAIPNSDPPSESGSSSVEFVPDGVTPTEDDETTEGVTEDTDVERPKKKGRKGKGRKEKLSIRKAINHAKKAMEVNGEEILETPRPTKRTHKPTPKSSVSLRS